MGNKTITHLRRHELAGRKVRERHLDIIICESIIIIIIASIELPATVISGTFRIKDRLNDTGVMLYAYRQLYEEEDTETEDERHDRYHFKGPSGESEK